MDTLKIQVPSIAENIRIVESFIDNAKDRFSIPDDVYGNIMVAITESVNNAIIHGNACDADKSVSITMFIENHKSIRFLIQDQGTGFDYNHLPDPTAPENLDKPGGRGIFLMKNLADLVNFFDEGRTVELTFNIH